MQLTPAGEIRMDDLHNQERKGKDPFNLQEDWTLREISHRSPIFEERFYSEILKYTTVKPTTLKASVTRLVTKGLVSL